MKIELIKKRISEIRKNADFLNFDIECKELQAEYNRLVIEKIKLENNTFVDYSSNKGGLNYQM